MSGEEIEQALISGIAQSGASQGEEAAIRLLIANWTWLNREELRRHIAIQSRPGQPLVAWIDWADLCQEPDQSPASTAERAILRLACSLAGWVPAPANRRWSILDMLSTLDVQNTLLASRAFAMAAIGPMAVGPLR